MDPQQRLFLEESWKALEDAGLSDQELDASRCGVFIGCKAADYQCRIVGQETEDLSEVDGHVFGDNETAMLPARLSYFLNLRGPSVPVLTACSSSLVAVHLACESLRAGTCDIAIAGGVELMTTPALFLSLTEAGVVSPGGVCRPFDDGADGIVLGEGIGIVILKRIEDAGSDRVAGMIRASGINQDGRSSGIHAPNGAAQTALVSEVYRKAGIDPETIGYVEAHGTGTVLGDPVEFRSLAEAFRQFTTCRAFCPVGSVKANIGHALAAAGIHRRRTSPARTITFASRTVRSSSTRN